MSFEEEHGLGKKVSVKSKALAKKKSEVAGKMKGSWEERVGEKYVNAVQSRVNRKTPHLKSGRG